MGARVISTNLNFSNPFVDPTLKTTLDRDLGDAVIGSTLVRHVTALGGVRPYTFSSTNLSTFSGANNLVLDTNGSFHTALTAATATTLSPLTAVAGALRFDAIVVDSLGSGNTKTARYRLNVLAAGTQNQFRVAVSGLSNALQFVDYIDNLDAINGVLPYTWTATNVAVGTSQFGSLDAIGLHLASNGTLFGSPLVAGNITFTAVCTDAAGNVAKSRSGVAGGQAITIPVAGNTNITSTAVCTQLTIGGNTVTAGGDKFSYTGTINTQGVTPTGIITFQINGASFSIAIGANGKISGAPSQTLATKSPTIKGSVNSKGQLKLTGSNLTLFSNGGITGRSVTGVVIPVTADVGVMVRVAISTPSTGSAKTSLDSAQAVALPTKVNSKGGVSATFKIGVGKNGNDTLSGAFILTSVQGKDDVKPSNKLPSGFLGDDWKVNYIAVPPNGVITNTTPAVSFTNVANAVVSVGLENLPSVPVTPKNNGVKTGKTTKGVDSLTSLSIASSGKGSYVTGPLDTNKSLIPTTVSTAGAALASSQTPFAFGTTVALTDSTGAAVFSGTASQQIYAGKNKWTSTPPKGK